MVLSFLECMEAVGCPMFTWKMAIETEMVKTLDTFIRII